MNEPMAWLPALATVAVLAVHEAVLAVAERRHPERMARSAHATLREDWFAAVSQHQGAEILAVQTLRNSLMSATMTASTAMLGLIGTVTLAVPSLRTSLGDTAWLPNLSPRLVLELIVLALLVASLVCSAMAVRYYNHVGFICGMPAESAARALGRGGRRLRALGRRAVQLGAALPHPGGAHPRVPAAPVRRASGGGARGGGAGPVRPHGHRPLIAALVTARVVRLPW